MRKERKFVATTTPKLFGEWRFATGTNSSTEETDQKRTYLQERREGRILNAFLKRGKIPFLLGLKNFSQLTLVVEGMKVGGSICLSFEGRDWGTHHTGSCEACRRFNVEECDRV